MVDLSQWPAFLTNVGVVIGAGIVAFVVLKMVVGLLASLVIWANTDTQEPSGESTDAQEQSGDPADDDTGLHVFSDYGARHRLVDKRPTEKTIRATIRSLDWVDGFHQVQLITSPGVSLEVGGSLDPEDGLSSVYRDSYNDIFRVTRAPPTTVENMEDLLVSFYLGDGRWEQMYDYEYIPSSVV